MPPDAHMSYDSGVDVCCVPWTPRNSGPACQHVLCLPCSSQQVAYASVATLVCPVCRIQVAYYIDMAASGGGELQMVLANPDATTRVKMDHEAEENAAMAANFGISLENAAHLRQNPEELEAYVANLLSGDQQLNQPSRRSSRHGGGGSAGQGSSSD